MISKNATPEEILAYAQTVREVLAELKKTSQCVVMFVDLVGSTEFKDKHPGEDIWLPRLAAFLASVSRIVTPRGRVVKYIGDEVMAVFDGPNASLSAEQVAEQVIAFCLASSEMGFEAKIAMDAGAVTLLDFRDLGAPDAKILGDPQGIVVDRCARIARVALPNTIVASSSFVSSSKSRRRWRRIGALKAKGIGKAVQVYQLRFAEADTPRVTLDEQMSAAECKRLLHETQRKLEELKALHQ